MAYKNLNEQELRELAKKRVRVKKEFKTHLIAYIVVNSGLFLIYAITNWGGYPWFIWPILGWGIGLVFHFVATINELKGNEEIEIDNEVERLKKM